MALNFDLAALSDDKVQSALSATGKAMRDIGAASLDGLGKATRSYASFEQEMLNARSVAQWTEQDYQRLCQFAIKVGANTKFSAGQAAQAIDEISRSGVKTVEDIEALTRAAANFAAAGGMEIPEASRAIKAAVDGFRLPMGQATQVADTFTRSLQLSVLQADELPAAVDKLAGVAGQAGQSVESAMAGLMAARAAMGSAEKATASYGAAMAQLIAPTDEASGILGTLGISLHDPQGRMRAWPEIIAGIQESFASAGPLIDRFRQYAGASGDELARLANVYGLSGAQMEGLVAAANQGTQAFQDYALATVFGQGGIQAVTAGLNAQTLAMVNGREVTLTGADALRYWQQELEKSGGSAQEAADVQMSGLEGAMEELRGSLESAGLSLAGPLAGPLGAVAKLATSLVDIFNGLPQPLKDVAAWSVLIGSTGFLAGGRVMDFLSKLPDMLEGIKTMGKLLSDLGVKAALTRVKLLAQAAATYVVKAATAVWTGVQWLLNASLWGCPIVWIIAGIAALVVGIILLVKNWDKVTAAITTFGRAVGQFFVGVWQKIVEFMKGLWAGIVGVFQSVVGFLKQWWPVILAVVAPFIGLPVLIVRNWDKIKDFFRGLGTAIWDAIKGIPGMIANAFTAALDWIVGFLTGIPAGIVDVFQSVVGFFRGWWTSIQSVFAPLIDLPALIVRNWDAITAWFRGLGTTIISAISSVPQMISGILQNVVQTILGFGQSLLDAGSQVFGGLWSGIKNALGIHSPSYIERAMLNVGDASRGTLIRLKRDFGEMNKLTAAPRVGIGMASGGQVIEFPPRVAAMADVTAAGGGPPRIAARSAGTNTRGGEAVRSVIRQPVQLVLDGRIIAETVLEFAEDREDREVS